MNIKPKLFIIGISLIILSLLLLQGYAKPQETISVPIIEATKEELNIV